MVNFDPLLDLKIISFFRTSLTFHKAHLLNAFKFWVLLCIVYISMAMVEKKSFSIELYVIA
jgi:hypothetical protein